MSGDGGLPKSGWKGSTGAASHKNFPAGKMCQVYERLKFTTRERPVQRLIVLVEANDSSIQ